RDIAMKELLPGMKGSSLPGSIPRETEGSGGVVDRFLREAKITGQLEHPSIVPVYEIGRHEDGQVYYTMRFIRGHTLAERLREIRKDESLQPKQRLAARIELLDRFLDVCQAIAFAHSRGVIHRDIKPDNIMLGDFGETLVLDWGLARIKGQEDKALRDLQKGTLALSHSLLQTDSQALTVDGSIVGTPAYMPPEQARGELEQVDEQSDVYALGAVLYQVLSGSPPYEGPMAALIVQQVLNGPPLSLRSREPDLPPELCALVERAMARDKGSRLKSAADLAAEIKAFRDGRTLGSYTYSARELMLRFIRQHRTAVSIAVLGFLLLVAGAIWGHQQVSAERDLAQGAQVVAEREREQAQAALDAATEQRRQRERVEAEQREAARKLLESRVAEAQRLLTNIEGMRIEPALQDLATRVKGYDAECAAQGRVFLELPLAERTGNGVLLSSILGYISQQQNLLDLLTGPAGAELPPALRGLDLAGQRSDLEQLRLQTARLATYNGDFPLAELVLSGFADPARAAAERSRVAEARAGLLQTHALRVDEALFDVRQGLDRGGRPAGAPSLDQYVALLSSYREPETVALLETELKRLDLRAGEPQSSWLRPELQLAELVYRVLGNVDQPRLTVPLLAASLRLQRHPRLIAEAAAALCATRSVDAFEPLLAESRFRGLDFWQAVSAGIALLPLPEQVRNPASPADYRDRALAMLARSNLPAALDAANRAVNLDTTSAEALLVRARVQRARGETAASAADTEAALALDQAFYEARLLRGELRDPAADGAAALQDYSAAIALRPNDSRAYVRRARAAAVRFLREQAIEDYEQAARLEPTVGLLVEHGQFLVSIGRLAEAELAYNRAIELDPWDSRGWSWRGVLRRTPFSTGFWGAVEDLRKAIELNPRDAHAWTYLGQVYYGMENQVAGIDACNRAIELDPGEWEAFYYRAILHLAQQNREDTRRRQGEGLNTYADTRLRNLSQAAADFRGAVAVKTDDYRSWALLGTTLMELERYDEAREPLQRALSLSMFGAATMQMGDDMVRLALAELDARPLLERPAVSAADHMGLALVHMGLSSRRYNEAGRHLRQAVAAMTAAQAGLQRAPSRPDRYRWLQRQESLVQALEREGLVLDAADAAARIVSDAEFDVPALWTSLAHLQIRAASAVGHGEAKSLGADDADGARRMAELAALPLAERLARARVMHEEALRSLEKAAEAGFRDAALLERDARFAPLRELAGWAALVERVKTSAIEPRTIRDGSSSLLVLTLVVPFAPADQLGLRRGDVLFSLNGTPLRDQNDLPRVITALPDGAEYELRVRRYVFKEGRLQLQLNAQGQPLLDEHGNPQWAFEELTFRARKGFLGIQFGVAKLPSPLFE
ncbi:MAG: protein kinase, partial [Planctomycetes bacterium]|nr:protein kinase [Planctomycetota bacterium]